RRNMLKVAMIFQDHMTLQRDKPVSIWGTAHPGDEVIVTVQGLEGRCRALGDGSWRMVIGPLSMSFSECVRITDGRETIVLADVQIGDVYLAAGQSNMEFYMRYDADFAQEKKVCVNENIRFFDYPEVSYPGQLLEADYGKNFGFWRKADPGQLQWFSAPAYYFAKTIQARYEIPVGLIGCNWGGTPACAWMSEESIKEGGGEVYLEEYRSALEKLDLAAYDEQFRANPSNYRTDPFADPISDMLMEGMRFPEILAKLGMPASDISQMDMSALVPPMGPKKETRPCGLYESMLCQVAPYGLRGILYYQGESDGDAHPEVYATLFPALIRGFRRLWQEELPFLFVQLAPFGSWLQCVGEPYAIIRMAQEQAAQTVPGTGMAVITDIGMEFDIHPKKKKPVGERLALLAENRIYGEDVLCEAPSLCEAKVEEGVLTLRFNSAGEGLYLADHTPDGAATDPCRLEGLKLWIDETPIDTSSLSANAQGDSVILCSEQIHKGEIRAELGIGAWYRVNLYNSADLPARCAQVSAGK
ncbi:MAG: hypothetical protein IIZ39_01875, partial [Blautia sp.]|nr:hypothetical protein [Blautia sp.]